MQHPNNRRSYGNKVVLRVKHDSVFTWKTHVRNNVSRDHGTWWQHLAFVVFLLLPKYPSLSGKTTNESDSLFGWGSSINAYQLIFFGLNILKCFELVDFIIGIVVYKSTIVIFREYWKIDTTTSIIMLPGKPALYVLPMLIQIDTISQCGFKGA